MSRLDGGHTVALDDPIAAARFLAEEVEFWRDAGHLLLRAVRVRRAARSRCSRSAARTPTSRSTARTWRCSRRSPARSRRRSRTAGSTGSCTSRPRSSAACASSTRTSSSRSTTAWWCSTRTSGSSAGTARSRSFYGVARDDAIGRPLADVFDAPFVEALRAARREHPDGATLFRVPLDRARRRDDGRGCSSTRPSCRCRIAAGDDATVGTILHHRGHHRPVQLEEQLQISEKMASIGLLAAGVAHEVNTPLTGISSFTQMLLEGADPARSEDACCSRRSSGRPSAPRRSSTAC